MQILFHNIEINSGSQLFCCKANKNVCTDYEHVNLLWTLHLSDIR